MTSGSVLFRLGTLFPKTFTSPGRSIYSGWITSESDSSHDVDQRIRGLGWHFMWLSLYSTRVGVGRTEAAALKKAMHSGLHHLNVRFNTAELMDVAVRKYPGFCVARVKLASRHIQEHASLGLVDEAAFRIHPALPDATAA